MTSRLELIALEGIGEIAPGDDLVAHLAEPATAVDLRDDDVLVVTQKIVSKAEGRIVDLATVEPSPLARDWAERWEKDPRQVELVLRESASIVRMGPGGLIISRTRHGLVCANAGVDTSNAPEDGALVLLPRDPDASARALRAALPERPAVVVADSFGRAWRHGQCDVAIGIAGLAALDDWRGRRDPRGLELRATAIAIADEAAAAADLVRDKASRQPAVVVRGLARHVTPEDGPGAAALIRPVEEDLFL